MRNGPGAGVGVKAAGLQTGSGPGPLVGANLALICADAVLCYLRDDFDGLPYRGLWDLPGGGSEPGESPADCALRELAEEFGLTFGPDRLLRGQEYPSVNPPGGRVWLFVGRIEAAEIAAIRFGDEGQYWRMMPVAEFLTRPDAVPHLQMRLAGCLARGFPAPGTQEG